MEDLITLSGRNMLGSIQVSKAINALVEHVKALEEKAKPKGIVVASKNPNAKPVEVVSHDMTTALMKRTEMVSLGSKLGIKGAMKMKSPDLALAIANKQKGG